MYEEEAIAYLTQDGGRVPCSRYGRNSEDCAPVAYALAEILQESNGDPIDEETLDFFMGLVVNDSDEVLSLIMEYGSDAHRDLVHDALVDTYEHAANDAGRERGKNAGSWVLDSNSTADTARRILIGYNDGDPEIMDMQPAPLSGEWAGESIAELSAEYGVPLDVDELATAFEDGFAEGFWVEVTETAYAMVDDNERREILSENNVPE